MTTHSLPIYAIVELLMRIAEFKKYLGGYKDHTFKDRMTVVKTDQGTLNFPNDLIAKQFLKPEDITHDELLTIASSFKPFNI